MQLVHFATDIMVMTPINNPATASWSLSISDSDFAKLKRGLLARSSDDRWAFLAMSGEKLVEEEAQRWAPERRPSTPEDELTEEEQTRRDEALFEEMEREELERDERDAEWEAAADLIHLARHSGYSRCAFPTSLNYGSAQILRAHIQTERPAPRGKS